MFTIHYRVTIKSSAPEEEASSSSSSSTPPQERDIFAMWQAFSGRRTVVDLAADPASYYRFSRFLCPPGERCSHVTDPVACTGYRFSISDNPRRDKSVDVQDLALVLSDGASRRRAD